MIYGRLDLDHTLLWFSYWYMNKVEQYYMKIYWWICFWMDVQVVKNVASQSLEVKKLVYLYLLHYAEKYVIHCILLTTCSE